MEESGSLDIVNILEFIDDLNKYKLLNESTGNELKLILNDIDFKDNPSERIRLSESTLADIKSTAIRNINWHEKEMKRLVNNMFADITMHIKKNIAFCLASPREEFICLLLENKDIDPDLVFESMHVTIVKKMLDVLIKYKTEQLINILDSRKESLLENMKKFIYSFLDLIDELLLDWLSLWDEFKRGLKEELQSKYPAIGKSNLFILESPKKFEKDYLEYIKKILFEKINQYIEINMDNYEVPSDYVNSIGLYLTYLLKEGFQECYEEFVYFYMNYIFKEKSDKKKNIISKITPRPEEEINKLNCSQNKEIKIKTCPNKINEFLDVFLDNLWMDIKTSKQIRDYIVRIYLNNKAIRIKYLIEKFSMNESTFTEEFINQAKGIWIFFENRNWDKPKENEIKIESSTYNSESIEDMCIQIEDEVKTTVEKKINLFLNNIKAFDWIWFVKIMQLAWYEMENENYVSKCFNKLYHNAQMKQIFLEELRKNIFSQEKVIRKKSSYRKINIYQKKWHRILFIQNKKTIDWIYNHDDYEKRVDVFLWC